MQGKLARAAAALCAGALLLTGCGGTENAQQTKEKVRLMVWSPSEDQSQSSGQWLQTCCERFAEMHPEWDITFVYGVADEASAATAVAQDPEASADVFLYANDTLTTMTDAKALAKFGGKYADEIRATNSETAAGKNFPAPQASPTAAANHIVAAVVSPFTFNPWRRIAPAPRKPIPETTCAAIRPGSPGVKGSGPSVKSPAIIRDSSISKAEPTQTRITVFKPAGCRWN